LKDWVGKKMYKIGIQTRKEIPRKEVVKVRLKKCFSTLAWRRVKKIKGMGEEL